ncbi:MAG: site-specific DNA-methyltransferase [Candidatus Bathyarchaeia archaeon]|jgi:adenine-specific DNA-methyltransferase
MSKKKHAPGNANVSRRRNDELLRHISAVRRFVEKASGNPTLLRYLDDVRRALVETGYGLTFEEHLEGIEKLLDKNDIKLAEMRKLAINNGKRSNLLIEGENLAALRHLSKSYAGKVDVIYIDPPYNTGMESLNYDDYDYADAGDAYVHSKWLSFMDKRIRAAYGLLSENGVMFIHIDEHETGTLLLLCQTIFGEANVVVLVWPKTDPKFDQNRVERPFHNIKTVHENIFACFKDKNKTNFSSMMMPSPRSGEEYAETPTHMETILKGLGTTSSAKDELEEILGRRDMFRTPKPMKLVKELVRVAGGKHALVLDFFAGSGTTGHAVMDLNKEDGGDRKFVLVNNSENEICRKVTYERLIRVIEREHYQESLRYFKIKYVPKDSFGDNLPEKTVKEICHRKKK